MHENQPPGEPPPPPQRGNRRGQSYGPAPTYGYGGGDGGGGYSSYGGYGGYGYGGGHHSATDQPIQRTLQDYLVILRERLWYIIAIFVVVVSSTAIFTFTQTPQYQATSSVQIFRRAPTIMQMQQVTDSDVRSAEDLNTQVNLLKSYSIVERVAKRLEGAALNSFLQPYRKSGQTATQPPAYYLDRYRTIAPQRLSLNVNIQYRHPDPAVAAAVADLFAEEYIKYNAAIKVDGTMEAVEVLKKRGTEHRLEVARLDKALQEYRARNNLVSLEEKKDITTETLKQLSSLLTVATAELRQAETRWNQVRIARNENQDLLKLPFIATVPAVSELQKEVAARKIAVEELGKRVRALHPEMIAAAGSLKEAETQLAQAIVTATAQVESSFQNATQNLAQAQRALELQTTSSLALDGANVEYSAMKRELDVAESALDAILKRETETSMSSDVEAQSARLVDRAQKPFRAVSPNTKLNLALGVLGGLALGIGLAFFISYIDDRVKSAFDIEAVVGLPLLAIVPKFRSNQQGDDNSATAFAALKEPEITEAFSTLYSSLRLKDDSKAAKCIVVTSTVPGEGKSFISRNLAVTFASHGERVLLMDCDLRRPVAHRPFQVENLKGVIDICESDNGVGAGLIDSSIVKNVQPGLDLMPSGGRSKNPAQNLTSKNFEILLVELRKRYDRIFIDTPPVALVSDALVILPLADGSIYSIFFNKVRRKAVQFCVRRLVEINIPTFGAVLNGLDQNIGGYYYHHYYDKKYKNYYVNSDEEGARPGKGKEQSGKR